MSFARIKIRISFRWVRCEKWKVEEAWIWKIKESVMWIDRDTTSEQVPVLLDAVESDEEDEIDNLMNDSDTKFIMEEEIAVEKNENNSNDGGDLLVPDTNVHIVLAENGEDETKKAKKSKGK